MDEATFNSSFFNNLYGTNFDLIIRKKDEALSKINRNRFRTNKRDNNKRLSEDKEMEQQEKHHRQENGNNNREENESIDQRIEKIFGTNPIYEANTTKLSHIFSEFLIFFKQQ